MAEFSAESLAREHGFQSRDELTTQLAWRLAEAAFALGQQAGDAAHCGARGGDTLGRRDDD